MNQRILSGITPSGSLTLGNYLGALKRFAESSAESGNDGDGTFFVADLHAMTTPHDPARLRKLTRETAQLFLASGIDPDRSTVFVQSQVPEHVVLGYLLECTAHVGELGRMVQFKEKGGRPRTRASLFTYPCLMAADILLYETDAVPVGGDQDQHVELARDLAGRFNRAYGETFVVPALSRAAIASRIADLTDPTSKMHKSAPDDAAGVVRMLDGPQVVRRKITRATTDSQSRVTYDPLSKPGVSNLLEILASCTGAGSPAAIGSRYDSYAALKADVAEAVIGVLEPIQMRYAALQAAPQYVDEVLASGARKASVRAAPVLARARAAIGLCDPAISRPPRRPGLASGSGQPPSP
jgi:tryptophanyl-tRNA synthetase